MSTNRIARAFRQPVKFTGIHQRSSERRQCFSTTPKQAVNDPATALHNTLRPPKSPNPPQSTTVESRRPNEAADSRNPFLNTFPSTARQNQGQSPSRRISGEGSAVVGLLRANEHKVETVAPAENYAAIRALENQNYRQWLEGDIIAPHDLSPAEHMKARRARLTNGRTSRKTNSRKTGGKDMLDHLDIDPLKEFKNFALMSEFVTEMGKIKHSRVTGLRAVNQRKMAKAIRRAVGMGLMPSTHRHPELMQGRLQERGQANQYSKVFCP